VADPRQQQQQQQKQQLTKFERNTNTAKSAHPQRPKSSFLDPQQPKEEYKETKSLTATNPSNKLTKSAVQKCDAQQPTNSSRTQNATRAGKKN
jgi:hypothetical protein